MKFFPGTWNKWQTIRVLSGDCGMIIGVSAGPRILSLSIKGSANLLYHDTTGFKVGNWYLYGGHRFTTAPENDATYTPDNEPCEVEGDVSGITVRAATRPDGLKLSLKIVGLDGQNGFELTHMVENRGSADWTGALWAITCVPRNAMVKGQCATRGIHYWPGTNPLKWQHTGEQITVQPGNHRGKAGWHQPAGWLSASLPEGELVIYNTEPSMPEDCVDEGSNLEVFVCNDYVELETLGRRITIPPGGSAVHIQKWRLNNTVSNQQK